MYGLRGKTVLPIRWLEELSKSEQRSGMRGRGGRTHLYKETKVVFKLLQKKTAQSE